MHLVKSTHLLFKVNHLSLSLSLPPSLPPYIVIITLVVVTVASWFIGASLGIYYTLTLLHSVKVVSFRYFILLYGVIVDDYPFLRPICKFIISLKI